MKSFVILSYGHSGTSSLNSILNQHPKVKSYGEVFNMKYNYAGFKYTQDTLNSKDLEKHIDEFLSYNNDKEVIGCNLHFPHIDFFNKVDAFDLIYKKFSKVIILKRNPLRVFFRGVKSINFNIKSYEKFLNLYNNNFIMCDNIPSKLLISSEQFFNKTEDTVYSVCDYLELEKFSFIDYSKKQHSDNMSERIENFSEVKDYLLSNGLI